MRFGTFVISSIVLALAATALFVGCGGNTNTSTSPAYANVSISDPAVCQAPSGSFDAVYVTIKDVQVSTSSDPNTSAWVDLTPSLSSSPMQINLLGIADNNCFLAMLGDKTELQPGSYQQIRIMLVDNNSGGTISNNKCAGNAANCVLLAGDATPYTLQLSSEAQTGIKIPSGQLAGGQFSIAAGQTKDLNIDFNTCMSIVVMGTHQYRLKPVLHAGEVSLTSDSINGTVVDSVTKTAVVGGSVIVALEQRDPSNNTIDRVFMADTADGNGQFVFCPVPAGTYDVVAVGIDGQGHAYAATIISTVQPGTALGKIPLVQVTGANTSQATITGQVTSTTGSAAAPVDAFVSPMQSVSGILYTIPLVQQSAAVALVTTATGASCPANTDCVSYSLAVPPANPNAGTFNASGTTFSQAGGEVDYTVDGQAFVPNTSQKTSFCNPSDVQVNTLSGGGALAVTPGTSVTAATIAFTGCQ